VEWWRGNQFEQQNPPPVKVTEEDLCDELWANATARRQIRVIFVDLQRFNTEYKLQLGKWIHAGEMRSQEDQILEFRDQPYTDEIESALRPHLQTLENFSRGGTFACVLSSQSRSQVGPFVRKSQKMAKIAETWHLVCYIASSNQKQFE
jgi:hypothetical protein